MGELAPSIIAADFGRLAEELGRVEPFSKRWHVDIMDGHYVPNLTIGPMIVSAIAAVSGLPQDVHLMITNPDATWQWYADAGASRIAFHPEASADAVRLLRTIRERGLGAGLAVNPDVEADDVKGYLDEVDHLVVMSVNPGFSGQSFIRGALPKLERLREWVDATSPGVQLVIDGGVNLDTAPECVAAGADVLVSASAIFGAADPADVARRLRELAEAGTR
ncbi:MAG: ribulose-phosphate 3-epimerase [Candidatus Binatia bacterium]